MCIVHEVLHLLAWGEGEGLHIDQATLHGDLNLTAHLLGPVVPGGDEELVASVPSVGLPDVHARDRHVVGPLTEGNEPNLNPLGHGHLNGLAGCAIAEDVDHRIGLLLGEAYRQSERLPQVSAAVGRVRGPNSVTEGVRVPRESAEHAGVAGYLHHHHLIGGFERSRYAEGFRARGLEARGRHIAGLHGEAGIEDEDDTLARWLPCLVVGAREGGRSQDEHENLEQ